jgi:hypothetical protein
VNVVSVGANGLFARRCDIFAARLLEDLFSAVNLSRALAMNRDENAAVIEAALVALGFVLRDAHANERTDEATDGTADAEASERTHDRTCGDERTDTGDGECAETGEEPEGSAKGPAAENSGCGAFGRLGILLGGKLFRALLVGQKDRDIVVREASSVKTALSAAAWEGKMPNAAVFLPAMVILLSALISWVLWLSPMGNATA